MQHCRSVYLETRDIVRSDNVRGVAETFLNWMTVMAISERVVSSACLFVGLKSACRGLFSEVTGVLEWRSTHIILECLY